MRVAAPRRSRGSLMSARFMRHGLPLLTMVFVACGGCSQDSSSAPGVQTPAAPLEYNALERTAFNRRAAELFLPLFWREDGNSNKVLEPNELAVLVGYPQADRSVWVNATGDFTPAFDDAYQQMVKPEMPPAEPA